MKIKPRGIFTISELSGKKPNDVFKLPPSLIYEMVKSQIRREAEESARKRREWEKRLNVYYFHGDGNGTGLYSFGEKK